QAISHFESRGSRPADRRVNTMEMRSRHTIRKAPPGNQAPRYIEPWIYPEAKADTTLAKLEVAFRTALRSVNALEDRVTANKQSGKRSEVGLADDALQFAASKLAPQIKRARLAVDSARAELAAKRGKLTLQPADKTDLAAQARRLWKVDQLKKMSNS